jgi:hypothetical protein
MPEKHTQQPAPEITNLAEAKAYKRFLDSSVLEGVAASEAMQVRHEERIAAQQEDLARQAEMIAQNPDAITGIPEHIQTR